MFNKWGAFGGEKNFNITKMHGTIKRKYLYKFETLVPFEVLRLRLDAAIPAPLPTEIWAMLLL